MSQPSASEKTGVQELIALLTQLQQDLATVATRQADSEHKLFQIIYSMYSSSQHSPNFPPSPAQAAGTSQPLGLSSTPSYCSNSSKIKPALPPDFNGDRMHGRAFLNSCSTYICLCPSHFDSDQQKILWAMSFIKDGCAAK